MLSNKVPFYYILIAILAGMSITLLFHQRVSSQEYAPTAQKAYTAPAALCDYNYGRLQGYKYIKPLVWVHPTCESEKYSSVKTQVSALIQGYISSGIITSASFDLRDLRQGDWTSINSDEKFSPGSLMKVPVMITILKMAEEKPGLLDQQVTFIKAYEEKFNTYFDDDMIKVGNKYTIRELLKRMIKYSDNDAASLICANIDTSAFKKTFTDFGFPEGHLTKIYPITSIEFADYMEMLYNAGYLTIYDSEYAMDLLASTRFKQGFINSLPDSIQVAHKFGESGDAEIKQLHESGIIYYKDSPYLLTVMTKGRDITKLPQVISDISKTVFADRVGQGIMAESGSH